jgi:hypothetical protein
MNAILDYLWSTPRLAAVVLVFCGIAMTSKAAPTNDNFTNATIISLASGSVSSTNVAATRETGEPNKAGNVGGASVWFRWVAPSSGTVTFNTLGSSFDTIMAVYTGTILTNLTLVAANDDAGNGGLTSTVTFVAAAGTEYRIGVDGYNGASGTYVLTWLYPTVNETALSTSVTNLSNFIYDSDSLYGGGTNRDQLRLRTTVISTNLSSALHWTTYVLSYRLLDTNGLAQPIYDVSGITTNSGFTCNVTNTILIGAYSSVTNTNAASLKPARRLDPYNQYTVEMKIYRLGTYTGATASTSPTVYLEYTNLVSGDTSYNTIPYVFSASWSQTYAIQTAPGQTAFQASVFYGLYRYDDFAQASPATNNVTVYLTYELHNATNGALIPLKNSSTNFSHPVPSYTAGAPKSVAAGGFSDNFLLEPFSQINSVSNGYYVLVKVSVDNNTGGPYLTTPFAQSPASQLLHFNGSLYFGTIETTLTGVASAPPLASPSGSVIPTTLTGATGYVTGAADHTFSGAGPFGVSLDSTGNAFVSSGSVVLSAPSPDNDSLARVNFQRGPVTLGPAGASATVTATLPTGLGYRLGDTSSQRLTAYVPFGTISLTASLNPTADLTFLPGSTIYAAEESKPLWLITDRILWHIATGKFDLPATGTGAVYVNAANYAALYSASNSLVDPPSMGDKRSNDKYWMFLSGVTSGFSAVPDTGSNALLSAQFTFSAGGFRTHFPYDTLLRWSGAGLVKIVDDLMLTGSASYLSGASAVSVPYSQNCQDCLSGATMVATPTMAVTNSLYGFTRDGGLLALGTLTSTDLQWGYIDPLSNFAQTAEKFTAASFHMPGSFIRGDQNTLPAVQRPATILYTGFLASNPSVVERPLGAGYSAGLADYAGLNFRAVTDNLHPAHSTIAGQVNIQWKLDARSKYYVRFGGVTGIHESVPGTFPANLTLWGYSFTFSNYSLAYLDSENVDSVTAGAISLPMPSAFTQNFDGLMFSCMGAPTGGDVPQGDGFKVMSYWGADFKTLSLEFATTNSCNPASGGYLALGIQGYASHVDKPLFGKVGFFPGGDIIPPSFGLPGITSRLKLPNVINIDGPNGSSYALTPVQDAYYNVWSNSPSGGAPGWISIYGKLDVPFFEDLQVHWQTSCHTNGVTASNAIVYLSGGWPRYGTTNGNHGWRDAFNRSPFQTNLFDYANRGWPGSPTIAKYRDNDGEDYHPRAQRVWLGFVNFDYPLSWNSSLRSFKSWQEVKQDLLVVNVQHQITYMDAKRCSIDFGAQYDGLPKISIANLAFNAIDEATGVGSAIVKAASQPVEDVLTAGLDEMNKLLDTQMKQLMDGVFDKTVNPIIDQFYGALSNEWNGLALSQKLQFVNNVQTNGLKFFLGQGAGAPVNNLVSALQNLGNGVSAANNLIGQIQTYINDASNAISAVTGVINTTTNGQLIPATSGLIAKQLDGSRPIVPKLLQSLVGDLAPQFLDAVLGPTVSNVVQEIEPQLSQIGDALDQVQNALGQASGALGTAGDFTAEIQNTLNNFTAQLTNASLQVSLSVTQYFGQFNYNIDNPFQHVSANDIKLFIRQKVEEQFFATDAAASIQSAIRQRVYDVDSAMKQGIDSVFQELNNSMRELIGQSLAELDNSINKCLGQVSDVIGAGQLSGHADIQGDSLKLLRIDGHFQFKVPNEMELNAFLEIKDLTSDGSSGCYSSNAPATEVTIGATGIPLDFAGTDAKANVEAKFTFDGSIPFPVNLGGQLELIGTLDFEAFQLHDLAAALAFGKYENYLALKGGVRFNGYDFSGAIFFGRTCSLDPIKLIDPDVASVLGNPPFTGAYCYAQGWLPISEMLTGVPASCLFEISAGIGAGAFYFAEGPTYGGKMFLGVSGSLLCIVSIEGDITMIGVKHGDDLRFKGHGHFEADIGPCPFCISISKSVDLSYVNKSWHID